MATGKKTGGRQKGTPNKATADIRALAREYAPDALRELARLAGGAESEQARVSAIKELLDRGYGKSTQPIAGDADGGPITIQRIERVIVDAGAPDRNTPHLRAVAG